MCDRKGFELNTAEEDRVPGLNNLPLSNRIPLETIPGLRRGVNCVRRPTLQPTGMIGMSVREHDSQGLQRFKFPQPVGATVNENSSRYHKTTVHAMECCPHIDLATCSEESEFHRTVGLRCRTRHPHHAIGRVPRAQRRGSHAFPKARTQHDSSASQHEREDAVKQRLPQTKVPATPLRSSSLRIHA